MPREVQPANKRNSPDTLAIQQIENARRADLFVVKYVQLFNPGNKL